MSHRITRAALHLSVDEVKDRMKDERPILIMAQDEGCFGRISRAKLQ
jgi:hypothetical protein